jgi:hypothetical protein
MSLNSGTKSNASLSWWQCCHCAISERLSNGSLCGPQGAVPLLMLSKAISVGVITIRKTINAFHAQGSKFVRGKHQTIISSFCKPSCSLERINRRGIAWQEKCPKGICHGSVGQW